VSIYPTITSDPTRKIILANCTFLFPFPNLYQTYKRTPASGRKKRKVIAMIIGRGSIDATVN